MPASAMSGHGLRVLPHQWHGRALFIADWHAPLFLHFAVPPAALQPSIPYPLDRYDGQAWLSLVLFHQRRLRIRDLGCFGLLPTAPIASHAFCNLRSYVRVRGEAGIVFLREWIPNLLARCIGPRSFGLPYRFGAIDLQHNAELGRWQGSVRAEGRTLRYRARSDTNYHGAHDPLAVFLAERYTAFTWRRGRRCFRIRHRPWPLASAELLEFDDQLATGCFPLLRGRRPTLTHAGPGVTDVRISRPLAIGRQP